MSWQDKKRVAVHQSNSHYFEYDSKPIWLSGHSRLWTFTGFIPQIYDVIDDRPENIGRHYFDRTYIQEIERVAQSGGHLFRMTPFWPDAWRRGVPMPWKRTEAGKFDLTQWDSAYFDSLHDFFARCAEQDIIVQFELWDRPGLSHWHPSRWPAHPFNPDNNINYGSSVLPGSNSRDIVWGKRLFYATANGENPELFEYQQTYINKLVEVSSQYPNVIYCIENEGTGGIKWERLWARYIKKLVPDALVTAMPLEEEDYAYRAYFEDPNFNCLDGGGTAIRYATHGTTGWFADDPPRARNDRLALIREIMAKYYLLMTCKPETTRPIYISNAFGDILDSIWALFCTGGAGFRYHRNVWEETEQVYCWVRAFNDFVEQTGVPFTEMAPANHLFCSFDIERQNVMTADKGLGLCLANDAIAVVFLPIARKVMLAVPSSTVKARVRLFDCDRGNWLSDNLLEPQKTSGPDEAEAIAIETSLNTGTAAYVEFK